MKLFMLSDPHPYLPNIYWTQSLANLSDTKLSKMSKVAAKTCLHQTNPTADTFYHIEACQVCTLELRCATCSFLKLIFFLGRYYTPLVVQIFSLLSLFCLLSLAYLLPLGHPFAVSVLWRDTQ